MLEIRLSKPSFLCKKSTLLLVESMILHCFVISTVSRVRFCVPETLANALVIIMLVCDIFLACAASFNLASAALFCVASSFAFAFALISFFVCLFISLLGLLFLSVFSRRLYL